MEDNHPNAVEMFNELIQLGYIVPENSGELNFDSPTAYADLPTTLAFNTPAIPTGVKEKKPHAKLVARSKRNPKRKR